VEGELDATFAPWVKRSARAVASYYGEFPFEEVVVRVMLRDGEGVSSARVFGGAVPTIRLGRNTRFFHRYIEDLRSVGVGDASVDVVVSNCVVNLSPRKDLVLGEALRVLRSGGELYISDVFADRRLPSDVRDNPIAYAECLSGAMYQADFVSLAKRMGFADPRVVSTSPIEVRNDELRRILGAARFSSVTVRLFKLDGLDDQCEDYGQVAAYLGGIEAAEDVFWLDDHHAFERGRPERVCGNTASMLADTRFARWFDLHGSRDTHRGTFACGPTIAAGRYASRDGPEGACC
jgi:SAM-dependent methyltransferase